MSAIKLFQMLCVGLLVTVGLGMPRALSQPPEPNQAAEARHTLINTKLDELASLLAIPLGEEGFRSFVRLEVETSRNREQMLDLETTVKNARANSAAPTAVGLWGAIDKAIKDVKNAVAGPAPAAAGAPPISLKLYFPVAEHREKWDGGSDLLVASAPSGDEKSIKSITAYSAKDGSVVILDVNVPPATPTIVVANDDQMSLGQTFPMVVSSSDPPEEGMPPVPDSNDLNSFIGMPYIKILNDNEPWYRGDPEIYVEVTQWYGGAAKFHSVDLPGVNDEYKCYYLGNGPGSPTYFYYSLSFDKITLFEFWEADSPDADDFLGRCYVNRDDVPFVCPWECFKMYRAGDVIFWVDKDP